MATIGALMPEACTHRNDAGALGRAGRELHGRTRLRNVETEKGLAALRDGIEAAGSGHRKGVLSGFTADCPANIPDEETEKKLFRAEDDEEA